MEKQEFLLEISAAQKEDKLTGANTIPFIKQTLRQYVKSYPQQKAFNIQKSQQITFCGVNIFVDMEDSISYLREQGFGVADNGNYYQISWE